MILDIIFNILCTVLGFILGYLFLEVRYTKND